MALADRINLAASNDKNEDDKDHEATNLRDKVEAQMNAFEIAEAQNLANDWLLTHRNLKK